MPSVCATERASITACGPQHLSSARDTQSCGQSLRVIPITSYPCSSKSRAAAEESTPPLNPITTRLLCSVTSQNIRAAGTTFKRLKGPAELAPPNHRAGSNGPANAAGGASSASPGLENGKKTGKVALDPGRAENRSVLRHGEESPNSKGRDAA